MQESVYQPNDVFDLVNAPAADVMIWIAAKLITESKNTSVSLAEIEKLYRDGCREHPLELLSRLISSNHQQALIREHSITMELCKLYSLPYDHGESRDVDRQIYIAFLRRWWVYVVGRTDDALLVAAAEPYTALYWLPLLERFFQLPANLCLLEPRRIKEKIDRIDSQQSTQEVMQLDDVSIDLSRFIELDEDDSQSQQSTEQLSRWLLNKAFELNASDIHLETRRTDVLVRLRIDGTLSDYATLPVSKGRLLVSRLKVLSGIDITESRHPLDGRMTIHNNLGNQEIRVSTMPLITGEKLVLRIFDATLLHQSLAYICTEKEQLDTWLSIIGSGNGLVLVTGPTGSGKTTTLYASLAHVYSPEINICTVENPVEMVDQRFNQVQVNADVDMGFAVALQSLLRQDPDVIMIGEIRNPETASIAVQAALTGHLVLATLHTNDALSAISRMLDLHVADFLLQSTLKGVLAQRLVRLTCPHCKAEKSIQQYCAACRRSGYLGRQAIFEIIAIDDTIRNHIRANNQEKMLAHIRQSGIKSLTQAGMQLVKLGKTSKEEIYRVCP